MQAIVIGGGISGLVAARTLNEGGYQVTVLEAAPAFGGMIAKGTIGGVAVDTGAEAFSPSPAMVDLANWLGMELAAPTGTSQILWREPKGSWPLATGLLGIPGSITDPAITGALNPTQIARLAEDLTMGPETGANAATVGELVATRLGEIVVERLVAPLARNVYGADPYAMPVGQYAGFLVKLMVQQGSLIKAVATARPPGQPSLLQPVGGMFQLIETMVHRMRQGGVKLLTDTPATALSHKDGVWGVETPAGCFQGDRLVITAPAAITQRLLAPLGVDFAAPPTRLARQVMLALEHPGLASDPVGTGVLVGQETVPGAKAMTHYSAKWPWLRQAGVEVVRIAYPAEITATAERALADAAAFLGLELGPANLVDFLAVNWENMPKAFTPAERAAFNAQIQPLDGLSIIGAWVSGNSLAGVVWQASQLQ